jgi:hypothetical protein
LAFFKDDDGVFREILLLLLGILLPLNITKDGWVVINIILHGLCLATKLDQQKLSRNQ